MAELTRAQQKELDAARRRAADLRNRLAVLREGTSTADAEAMLASLDEALLRIAQLEAVLLGSRAAAQRYARERAVRRVALEQVRAGNAIADIYARVARRLGGAISERDAAGLRRAIVRTIRDAATARDATILASARRVGSIANALDHDLALHVFGAEVRGQAGALGITLGSGVDPAVVRAAWSGKENALRSLLHARDRATASALTQQAERLISLGRDARKAFAELRAAGMPPARVSAWVDDLYRKALAAVDGDAASVAAFRDATRAARRYVAQRTKGPLGTHGASQRLVAGLERAVKSADTTAMRAVVERWVERKSKYEATTAMRTATNETYRAQINEEARSRPWVYAVRRLLSESHPRPDECDAIAEADIGLGPGVYPIGRVPEEHINGLCRDEPVIDADFFRRGGRPLAYRLPARMQRILDSLAPGGAVTRAARRAANRGEVTEALRNAGLVDPRPIQLRRVKPRLDADGEALPWDNVLGSRRRVVVD